MRWLPVRPSNLLPPIGLRSAVIGCTALTLAITAGAGAWGLWQLELHDTAARELNAGEFEAANLALAMRATLLLQIQALADARLSGDKPNTFARYAAVFDARADELQALRAQLEQVRGTLTPGERALLDQFDEYRQVYMDSWPRVGDAFSVLGALEPADLALRSTDQRNAVEVLGTIASRVNSRREATSRELTVDAQRAVLEGAGLLLASLVLGTLLSLRLAELILQAVKPIERGSRRVAEHDLPTFVSAAQGLSVGDLNRHPIVSVQPVQLASRFVELRSMAASFNAIVESLYATHEAFAGMRGELIDKAFYDPLTHLPNRALFQTRMQQAIATAGPEEHVAVLFLDFDNFKVINDSLGHAAGDELLVAVAQRLISVVEPEDVYARLGGDEFGVMLEPSGGGSGADTSAASQRAADRARQMLAHLEPPFEIQGKEVFVRASIGIALGSAGEVIPADLLRDADAAMYEAKRRGKSGFALFDAALSNSARQRLELETDLRHALERGEFTVQYQPIVSLHSGRVTEVEALVRWQHPQRGLIAPVDFIPLAEETGLIRTIGLWVLEEACHQARRWQAEYADRSLIMSVNLSARQLQQPAIDREVARVLATTGLPPAQLKLELTESVLLDDAATIDILQRLKALGVQLAIDDFGTGYSSLSYLRRFPFDTVKIDRAFVRGLATSPGDQAIVRAVVDFARALNLTVTAEGIESVEQLALLKALGCDRGQGYYLARPLTPQALGYLLQTDTGGQRAAA